jgi:hypothetical protein
VPAANATPAGWKLVFSSTFFLLDNASLYSFSWIFVIQLRNLFITIEQVQFSFSKSKPIREDICRVFEERRAIEADITSLMFGRECITDWDWEGLQ